MKFAIVGAGKVGTAVGSLLLQAGHKLTGYSCLKYKSLDSAKQYLGNDGFLENSQAVINAEIIFITTQDWAISGVCCELTASGIIGKESKVAHMSGALGLKELEAAEQLGAKVFCAHPLQQFPTVDVAVKNLPGSYFGVTAKGADTIEFANALVRDLGGLPIEIQDGDKPLYHAAATISSNYLIALLSCVKQLGESIGLDKNALNAYMPLIKSTLLNTERIGVEGALTGPIARGDVDVVSKHIEKISQISDDLLSIYRSLGKRTVEIAYDKGTISKKKVNDITELLSG